MPLPSTGKQLTDKQIATRQASLDQGANSSAHWAFTPLVRPLLQAPSVDAPLHNLIDRSILASLHGRGLSLSPPADKIALIRHFTLDLTGLPPTPEEVDAFLDDSSSGAYENLVDRLLASPRFGERIAWRWLEATIPMDRPKLAFRRTTGRLLTDRELAVLRDNLDHQLVEFRREPKAANRHIAIGKRKRTPSSTGSNSQDTPRCVISS